MLAIIIFEILFIILSYTAFFLSSKVYRKFKKPYFHTIIISVIVIITFLAIFHIDYQFYYNNTRVLRFLLDISVVAFGYLLYLNIDFLKKNTFTILFANFLGSSVGIVSVLLLSKILNASKIVQASLIPKSITTPLAVEISSKLGGIAPLTAVIVILCGLFGAIIGPSLFKILNIQSPLARGIALGTSAHGLGTAKALEFGALEGAVGGISIGLMGFFTSILSTYC